MERKKERRIAEEAAIMHAFNRDIQSLVYYYGRNFGVQTNPGEMKRSIHRITI